MENTRCAWCGHDPLYVSYHDLEWGVPVRDDRKLFEMLVLDGAQAGLSWITILRKRDAYIRAFDGFDPAVVAGYDDRKISELVANAGIVRNRKKIASAISNARAVLGLQRRYGSLGEFMWGFVNGQTIQNAWRTMEEIPAVSPQAEAMSKALKSAGCSFVGPTIIYAFMQAAGMVNDHVVDCYRHLELGGDPGGKSAHRPGGRP
jgi:DNA-3-methyladenine glycosylase I